MQRLIIAIGLALSVYASLNLPTSVGAEPLPPAAAEITPSTILQSARCRKVAFCDDFGCHYRWVCR